MRNHTNKYISVGYFPAQSDSNSENFSEYSLSDELLNLPDKLLSFNNIIEYPMTSNKLKRDHDNEVIFLFDGIVLNAISILLSTNGNFLTSCEF
ncbi:unnamed protein product [Clavelina lepadiformis]|uniref:Uncharacterized protein n=1 Tax=Clavelina lepadiformis TaxID=159417 RepID=A0ABP0FTT8_CLALP